MPGEGPFLWLRENSSPYGFWKTPPGGMCLSAFLFVRQGPRILLGKYADHPMWTELAGLDSDRVRANAHGWTIPASHLKFGEDPRAAARRVAEEILRAHGFRYAEPRVETDAYEARWASGKTHYDIWFLVDAWPKDTWEPQTPPWYASLAWQNPGATPAQQYARGHEDVVARWLSPRP